MSRRPTAFDHLDPETRDPARVFASLHEGCPVQRSEAHGGFLALPGHAEVRAAAQDASLFSSRSISIPDSPGSFDPITFDPPRHDRSRSILVPFFSRPRVERDEARIRALTTERLGAIADLGACDISRHLTRVVVTSTLLRLLGLPDVDRAEVSRWVDDLVFPEAGRTSEVPDAAEALHRYLYRFVLSPAAVQLGDDQLIGRLLRFREDGRALGADAIVNIVTTLLYGAIGPTTFLLNGALVALDQDAEARCRLVEEPELLTTATEELLRLISPVRSIGRTVTRSEPRFGHDFHEGDRVLLVWGAANRDPSVFADPDAFVVDRAPNRHLAFGAGIHRCLGAHLARVELRVVIGEVLRLLPDYRVDRTAGVGWQTGHMCGISRLPVTYGGPTRP